MALQVTRVEVVIGYKSATAPTIKKINNNLKNEFIRPDKLLRIVLNIIIIIILFAFIFTKKNLKEK